jgi:hypothetical protein
MKITARRQYSCRFRNYSVLIFVVVFVLAVVLVITVSIVNTPANRPGTAQARPSTAIDLSAATVQPSILLRA